MNNLERTFAFYDAGFELTFVTDEVLTTVCLVVVFFSGKRICSYAFNVNEWLFI